MKTTFHTRGPRWFLATPRTVGLVVLCVALFLAALVWRKPLAELFWRAMAPVTAARNALDASENARLKAEVSSLSALVSDRNMLYWENIDLKARLLRNAERKTVLAAVLMRPPGIPYDTLVIDAGGASGVAAGDFVSAGGSALIGRVSEVYEASARVVLFSAPGEEHEALLSLADGTVVPLVLLGLGGGALSSKVPAGTPVALQDKVIIPSITSNFSATVSAIEAPEGESFKTLHFHLPANLFSLRYVEVWVAPTL